MGAEVNGVNGKGGGLTVPPVPAGKPAGGRPEQNNRNPRPAGTPEGGTRSNPDRGTRPAGGTQEEKKVSGLAPVKEPPAVPAPNEPQKKQKRKPRKKKEEPANFNADQISGLILSASAIVASRPDMNVWALREEEAKQLATPIANMIAKSEKLQNMGEYADAIALVTASLVIFTPRAMVFADQKKKKKAERGVIVDKRKEGKSNAGNAKPVERSSERTPSDGIEPVAPIFAAIPATI